MKKIFLIIFFIPSFFFGQNNEVNNIINLKLSSLVIGTMSFSYERKVFDRHSLYVGLPIYFKRDLTNSKFLRLLAPLGDNYLYEYDQITNSTVNEILDDADDLAYISGFGFNLGYKFYLDKNVRDLTGFYLNPELFLFNLKNKIEADNADINFILSDNLYPDLLLDWDLDNIIEYDSDAKFYLQNFSVNFGHQWIKNWFSIDMKIGFGNYVIKYEYDDQISYNDLTVDLNKYKGTEILWLPRYKIKLGFAF